MPPAPPDGDVALFIDWENFKYSLYELGQVPDLAALVQAVRERYGRPSLARAYADWQDYYHRKSFDQMTLYAAGIEPVYVPTRKSPTQQSRIKNSVDVRMSLDCLEAHFTHPRLQTFVLVAGDADFQHVVGALRRRGARVIMIGVSGSTAQRLTAVVDELLFYDVDIECTPPVAVVPDPPAADRKPPAPTPMAASPPLLLPDPPPLPPAQAHEAQNDEEAEDLTPTAAEAAPEDSWAEDGLLVQQHDQFADVVLTADDIENSHREYMGRSLLARFLYNKGHWDPADLPARAAPIQSPAWGRDGDARNPPAAGPGRGQGNPDPDYLHRLLQRLRRGRHGTESDTPVRPPHPVFHSVLRGRPGTCSPTALPAGEAWWLQLSLFSPKGMAA